MQLYDKTQIDKNNLLYSSRDLWRIFIPCIFEQFLACIMGMVDTVMVSNVGPVAVSAVSLVDALNVLIVQVFAALGTGAAIICSQNIGHGNLKRANAAARQIFISTLAISCAVMVIFELAKRPLLSLIFGSVEQGIMDNAVTYLTFTAFSYPFLALTGAGAAMFRAGGNTRFPMIVATTANLMNIGLNALLIFGLGMGVAGAAIATLISRIFNMAVLYIALHRDRQPIVMNNYLQIRPDWRLIWVVLSVGIPSGIENGMFQFGKLAIQSTVSTLGTHEIAANAIIIVLEYLSSTAGVGLGLGLMTVVGNAIGAGRKEEARYYILKSCLFCLFIHAANNLIVLALTKPMIILSGMAADSAALCWDIMVFLTIAKTIVWIPAFVPAYGMRAAGDVKFSMIVSTCTMWLCRVSLSVFLVRYVGIGLAGVWIGMTSDWLVRNIIFSIRFLRGKWAHKAYI